MSSNSEDIFCNHSIKNDFRPVLIACCSIGAVSAVMCILAIVLIVIFRMYNSLTTRIILYLLVADLFYCLATVFLIFALWQNYWKGEHYKWCVAEGFLMGYSELVMLLSTLMVTLHLTFIVRFYNIYMKYAKRICSHLDALYLLISWILPLIIALIPFVHNNYGLSGPWCWIRLYNDDCSWNKEGMIEVYATFYGELILGLSLNSLALVYLGVTLYRRSNNISSGYRKVLKQTLPLIIFPIIYEGLSFIALVNRIYQSVHSGKYLKWLFFAHAITAAGWGFVVGLFLIIYLLKLSEFRNKVKKLMGIPVENTELKHLNSQDIRTKNCSYGNIATDPTNFSFSAESFENIEDEQIR